MIKISLEISTQIGKSSISIANRRAPEHLEIQVKNPEKIIEKLCNYGSLLQ